jgi:hypothetical protein
MYIDNMNKELKDAIIKTVQEHAYEFQLNNFITNEFREYIYTKDGNYLIGGEIVSNFISKFIILYIND